MKLAVFDIDGTLTRTVGLCDAHYAASVAAVTGAASIRLDWSLHPDATDSGMADALFRRQTGRAPDADELRGIHDRFLAALHAAEVRAEAVDGAHDVLDRVAGYDGWRVAIATGNWRAAAAVKLGWAGLRLPDVPMGTADDAPARAEILRAAIRRAGGRFERVVYLGDGPHDVRAAHAVGAAFVGVTAVRDASVLAAAGARTFLPHFSDDEGVRRALEEATVPELPRSGR